MLRYAPPPFQGGRGDADSQVTQRKSPKPVHSLVAIARNGWSRSIGTGGRDHSESVVAISRNQWSQSDGMRSLAQPPKRRAGCGRKPCEVKDRGLQPALERMLSDETAGDPMTRQRWVR